MFVNLHIGAGTVNDSMTEIVTKMSIVDLRLLLNIMNEHKKDVQTLDGCFLDGNARCVDLVNGDSNVDRE